MNYCEKIHYTILSTKRAEFAVMVDDLLSQLPQNEVIMRLAFFGTPGTNEEYVARRVLLREKIRRYYGDCEPALSYVSQPPLNAPLLMEVHSYVPDAQDRPFALRQSTVERSVGGEVRSQVDDPDRVDTRRGVSRIERFVGVAVFHRRIAGVDVVDHRRGQQPYLVELHVGRFHPVAIRTVVERHPEKTGVACAVVQRNAFGQPHIGADAVIEIPDFAKMFAVGRCFDRSFHEEMYFAETQFDELRRIGRVVAKCHYGARPLFGDRQPDERGVVPICDVAEAVFFEIGFELRYVVPVYIGEGQYGDVAVIAVSGFGLRQYDFLAFAAGGMAFR